MNVITGWPPGLLQDDSRELGRWFASRIDARRVVRQVCAEIEREKMTTEPKLPPQPEINTDDREFWCYSPPEMHTYGLQCFEAGCQTMGWTPFERDEIRRYGDARAAHAVAQMQGEPAAWLYDTDMADLAAGKNARVYPVDAKPHYKDTDRVVRFYTAPATAEQPAETREHILSAHIALSTCDGEGRVDKHHVQIAHEHIEAALGCLAATAPAPVAQAREITDAEIDALLMRELDVTRQVDRGDIHRIVRAAIALREG